MRILGVFQVLVGVVCLCACAPDRSGVRLAEMLPTFSKETSASEIMNQDIPSACFRECEAPWPVCNAYARALEQVGLFHFSAERKCQVKSIDSIELRLRLVSTGDERWVPWKQASAARGVGIWPVLPYRASIQLELEFEVWRLGIREKSIRLVESGETCYRIFRWNWAQDEADWRHWLMLHRLVDELKAAQSSRMGTTEF